MTRRINSQPDEALDRMLDDHLTGALEQLAPSSGFALTVMEAIEAEAAAPPPIAFPWRRVLPALLALLGCLAVLARMLPRETAEGTLPDLPHSASQTLQLLSQGFSVQEITLLCIAAAALLSIAAVAASFQLAGRAR